jgi:hypothetical protein
MSSLRHTPPRGVHNACGLRQENIRRLLVVTVQTTCQSWSRLLRRHNTAVRREGTGKKLPNVPPWNSVYHFGISYAAGTFKTFVYDTPHGGIAYTNVWNKCDTVTKTVVYHVQYIGIGRTYLLVYNIQTTDQA